MNKTIKVCIVDDDEDIRNGLSWMINNSEGFECVAVFGSGEEFFRHIPDPMPDVILMDIGLPGKSGIECVKLIKEKFDNVQIIMQTVCSEDEKIFESLRVGAVGYLLKKSPTIKVLQAITDAYEGGAPMTGEVARKVLNYFQKPILDKTEAFLSDREKEVLEALIEGHSYKAIAGILSVSVHTVRFHLHNIYEKLHVTSRGEAIAKVLKNKLL